MSIHSLSLWRATTSRGARSRHSSAVSDQYSFLVSHFSVFEEVLQSNAKIRFVSQTDDTFSAKIRFIILKMYHFSPNTE